MKKLLIFLDFDGVLNDCYSEYYSLIHLSKERVSNFMNFLNKLELEKIQYNIVLNTAWKMNKQEYFVEALLEKLTKDESSDDSLKELFLKFKGSLVTPTYDFSNYSEVKKKNNYNCKSFEVESFIVQNNIREEDFIFLYLDDEIVDFKYINILQYNTNPEFGFTLKDSDELFNFIKEEIKIVE